MSYLLGIDTGGTFTDAVLVQQADKKVIASAKSLTTRFDLSKGIGDSIGRLPSDLLKQVKLVSLSTTLTTNSVVEGRGAPICVLLAGYDETQVKNSGLIDLIGSASIVRLEGGHDASGIALKPLNETEVKEKIKYYSDKVTAFAISASFAVRNPAHEIQLKKWVSECCDLPVTCGHELASSLGAPRRALTVAMNARMISHVKDLIDAVQTTLLTHQISAPLMIVKGDGSLVNIQSALQQPVTTVLSGPAASVLGACAWAGTDSAIIADMGGTTTDIAVVLKGKPALSFDGALIGQWRPMVESIRVHAIGLGGDSELGFKGGEGFAIGPRRVVPISLIVHQHPHLLEVLKSQSKESPHPGQMRFVQRLRADVATLQELTEDEKMAWEALAKGPVDIEHANLNHRALAKALARLERKGLAIYSGFTPTDAAHVLGASHHWNAEAAHYAAIIWARQMRHLYGMGNWVNGDAISPSQFALDHVVKAICQKLIETGLNEFGRLSDAASSKTAALMAEIALHKTARFATEVAHENEVPAEAELFRLQFSPQLPLIAVGAPAASIYPHVARSFGMNLILPEHGAVANAYGAVLGMVCHRQHITINQVQRGVFTVFLPTGPQITDQLSKAVEMAKTFAAEQAQQQALLSGASSITVEFDLDENAVKNDIDGDLFFEARVTASAYGPPLLAE